MQGTDLIPVLADPSVAVRDYILFAQDSAQTTGLNGVRYALRGFTVGATKHARYYGVGGGKPSTGLWGRSMGTKLFDVDCAFDDNDHEWYDRSLDPDEPGQSGRRPVPSVRAGRRLRADAGLRAGVVRHLRVAGPLLGYGQVPATGPEALRSPWVPADTDQCAPTLEDVRMPTSDVALAVPTQLAAPAGGVASPSGLAATGRVTRAAGRLVLLGGDGLPRSGRPTP